MANQWYAQIMGNEIGPMSGGQLKQLAENNRIAPDDQVRKGEAGNWVLAERVKGLFPEQVGLPDYTPLSQSLTSARLATCPDCGKGVSKAAATCPNCGRQLSKSRVVAMLLAWVFGLTGAHKFYLGDKSQGIIYLGCSLTFVLAPFVALLAIIDGFKYLSMDDQQFVEIQRKNTAPYISDRMLTGTEKRGNTKWGTYAVVILIVLMVISALANQSKERPKQIPLRSIPKDNWTNSSIDTRGMSENQRIQLFHKFILIEDRFPGDKDAQRPYKQKLYDQYGIDEAYEIKLLGEAIDSKWPLPP